MTDDASFWDDLEASAALVRGLPAWTGAGVLDHHNSKGRVMTDRKLNRLKGGVPALIPALPVDADLETLVDRIVEARVSTASRQLPRALAWTATPPTIPGLYWHSNARGRGVVRVLDTSYAGDGSVLGVLTIGSEYDFSVAEFAAIHGGRWYGPLVAPEMDGEVEL